MSKCEMVNEKDLYYRCVHAAQLSGETLFRYRVVLECLTTSKTLRKMVRQWLDTRGRHLDEP